MLLTTVSDTTLPPYDSLTRHMYYYGNVVSRNVTQLKKKGKQSSETNQSQYFPE